MGVGHHYVPAWLIARWACEQAIDLLDENESAKSQYRRLLAGSSSRKRPVMHVQKASEPGQALKLACRSAERVFAKPRLYRLPEFASDLERGAARYLCDCKVNGLRFESPGEDHLIELGRGPFNENIFEVRVMHPFEEEMREVVRRVEAGGKIGHRRKAQVMNFVGFSNIRTAGWRENYLDGLAEETKRSVRRDYLDAGVSLDLLDHPLLLAYEVAMRRCGYLMEMARIFRNKQDPAASPLKYTGFRSVDILEASPESPGFIITDHPGRPTEVFHQGIRTTMAFFPLSPKLCLALWPRTPTPNCLRTTLSDKQVRMINAKMFDFAFASAVFPHGQLNVFPPEYRPADSLRFTEDIAPILAKLARS